MLSHLNRVGAAVSGRRRRGLGADPVGPVYDLDLAAIRVRRLKIIPMDVYVWNLEFRQDPVYVYKQYRGEHGCMIVFCKPQLQQRFTLSKTKLKRHWISVMRSGKKEYFQSWAELDQFYLVGGFRRAWIKAPGSYKEMWNEFPDRDGPSKNVMKLLPKF